MLRQQPTYIENPQWSPINYDWGYDDRSLAKAWTVRGLNTKRTSDHIRFLYEDAKVPEGIFLSSDLAEQQEEQKFLFLPQGESRALSSPFWDGFMPWVGVLFKNVAGYAAFGYLGAGVVLGSVVLGRGAWKESRSLIKSVSRRAFGKGGPGWYRRAEDDVKKSIARKKYGRVEEPSMFRVISTALRRFRSRMRRPKQLPSSTAAEGKALPKQALPVEAISAQAIAERDPKLVDYKGANPGGFKDDMDEKEAKLILTIDKIKSKEEIEKNYRLIMKKNHPDLGGSRYIGIKINEAKSLLFTSLEEKGVEADDDLGLEEEREVYVDKKDDDDKEEIDYDPLNPTAGPRPNPIKSEIEFTIDRRYGKYEDKVTHAEGKEQKDAQDAADAKLRDTIVDPEAVAKKAVEDYLMSEKEAAEEEMKEREELWSEMGKPQDPDNPWMKEYSSWKKASELYTKEQEGEKGDKE